MNSIKNKKLAQVTFLAILAIILVISFTKEGRTAASTVSAKEEEHKQVGYIERVYEENGKRYLQFDEVKFLTGDEAVEQAKKDGNAIFENGQYYVLDDYYIVNEDKELKDYLIDKDASLNMLGFMVNPESDDITNKPVNFQEFKDIVNSKGARLYYIYTLNGIVEKVEGQFIP